MEEQPWFMASRKQDIIVLLETHKHEIFQIQEVQGYKLQTVQNKPKNNYRGCKGIAWCIKEELQDSIIVKSE